MGIFVSKSTNICRSHVHTAHKFYTVDANMVSATEPEDEDWEYEYDYDTNEVSLQRLYCAFQQQDLVRRAKSLQIW